MSVYEQTRRLAVGISHSVFVLWRDRQLKDEKTSDSHYSSKPEVCCRLGGS